MCAQGLPEEFWVQKRVQHSLFSCREISAVKTDTVSCRWYGNNQSLFSQRSCQPKSPHPQLLLGALLTVLSACCLLGCLQYPSHLQQQPPQHSASHCLQKPSSQVESQLDRVWGTGRKVPLCFLWKGAGLWWLLPTVASQCVCPNTV